MAVADTKLYETLGVSPSASQNEIKAAYKKAAMKWHPDRWVNGTDEEKAAAETKFKEISAAYEVLGDEDKRRRYDTYGSTDDRQAPDADMEEMIKNVFGGMFGGMFGGGMGGGRTVQRGNDVSVTVDVTLEDVMNGADKTVTVSRKTRCHRCAGSGSEDNQTHQCPKCHGTGRVQNTFRSAMGIQVMYTTCPDCGGSGEVIEHPCPSCGGTGLENEVVEMSLSIPAGVISNAVSVIRGGGDAGPKRGVPGDLRVLVNVLPDSRGFGRMNDIDLTYTCKVPYKTMVFGGDIDVPYFNDSVKIHIDKGTPSGKVTRLYGKGFPSMDGTCRGDFLIKIECDIPDPKKLSKSAKDAIRALE